MPIDSACKDWFDKSEKSIPKGKYLFDRKEIYQVPMKDGTKLSTAVYFPRGGSNWPVLFTRNPYAQNKPLLEAVYLPLLSHGYCIVIQDCRGTGCSEGVWEPFINERDDGIDSLEWLSKQPWIDGNIATFGRSYSCFTQWIVADSLPEQVKTMFLEVYGVDRYRQVYMNGMFREDIYTSWAFANSGVKSSQTTGELYKQAIGILPAEDRDTKLLGQKLPFYQNYISEVSEDSPYWCDSIWQILKTMPEKITVPVVITDGWADHHLDGSIQGFEQLRPQVKNESKLIIGPWDHLGNTTGDLDYPDSDAFGFMNLKAHLDWFDFKLKGKGHGIDSKVYVIGAKKWHSIGDWPPAADPQKLFLSEGQRLKEAPSGENVSFQYNPQKPLTAPGGSALLAWITPGFTELPHGIVRQPDYTSRDDVLLFSTEPLKKPVTLLGKAKVDLFVSSSAEDTSFFVRLIEKKPDGSSYNITDGISSLSYRNNAVKPKSYSPGEKIKVSITLWDSAWQFDKGSQIELLISSSNFPMYSVHSNKKGPWAKQTKNSDIAKQTIFFGLTGSKLILPLAKN